MQQAARLVALFLTLVLALSLTACSGEKDPAILVVKDFIKKAATGDKSLKELIDFQAAANKYGTTGKEVIQKEGAQKWEEAKDDMVKTIIASYSPLKNSYKKAFKEFTVEEKGVDYWIVSYFNPAKERKRMKVTKHDGKLKAYFFQK